MSLESDCILFELQQESGDGIENGRWSEMTITSGHRPNSVPVVFSTR